MTDHSWNQGLQDLLAAFPDRDLDPAMLARRGEVYRRELGHLTDAQWLHAVSEALRSERWFPPVSALLEFAATAPRPMVPWLPESTLSPDERRALMREGMATIRAEMEARGMPLDVLPAMPAGRSEREERLAELRDQAAVICEPAPESPAEGRPE